jgi:hypothetical protein
MDVGEILRWSLVVNVFLIGLVLSLPLICFFWGLSVGRKVAEGTPLNAFGGVERGEVWQADDGTSEGTKGTLDDPLKFLDEQINRAVGQVGGGHMKKTLIDPELAGLNPEQAR